MQSHKPPQNSVIVSGFGSAVVDVLMMASQPIALQKKNLIEHQTIQIGGVIPTALVVLSRLGIATELHSLVGRDTFGNILLALLKKEHVGLETVIQKSGMKTPLSCVTIHKDNGQRTSFYTTGAFAKATDRKLVASLNPHTQFLIADGHNNQLTHEIIQKARSQRTFAIVDLGNAKPGIENLAHEADAIVIPKAYWGTLNEHNPKAIIKKFLTQGPSLVVLTMEEKGCLVGTKQSIFHQPSYSVSAVDTNGAGDVFCGTFMYGLTQSWELSKTARFACAAAARSCSIFGKDQKIPRSEEEVHTFIKSHALLQ
ncbi:hypothetical protein A3A63_01540 [Candidatus Gottesmanbacteria bacterium RIFCSPLOWO2_01_FULL_46_9]|uniref:Carbohydrate kinase PfkB domain-containing protein n=1 Tax=Candidatus Gottesmanbacteria bacterium RIFCSPLOWO2_01_FULL_46_9 TaxID=1798394 RepID=A0A1F6B0N1_9BACT|nr:MAG: hypothetical protein A3A63_01540 [Candidatus Gottesmanbacteria bacterium RIFCSPLOWO2_01_FULL_46_9]